MKKWFISMIFMLFAMFPAQSEDYNLFQELAYFDWYYAKGVYREAIYDIRAAIALNEKVARDYPNNPRPHMHKEEIACKINYAYTRMYVNAHFMGPFGDDFDRHQKMMNEIYKLGRDMYADYYIGYKIKWCEYGDPGDFSANCELFMRK